MAITAADRLADFVCEQRQAGLPAAVLHQAKRLLLNQLTASAAAALQPAGAALLAQAARVPGPGASAAAARPWWSAAQVPLAQAVALNAQLLGMLDLGDTHLPSLGRFTAAILPPLLAQADTAAHEGCDVLAALALGLEAEIAGAGMAAGHPPGLGALVAGCTLAGLDRTALATALGGFHATCMASGAPASGAWDGLGERWRLHDIALHCRPLPVQALAPVEAVLALRTQAGAREPCRMRLLLSPPAWGLLQAQATSAADELRHCMAAAWLLGRFTTDEGEPACQGSPAVRALAARIELAPDPAGSGIAACSLDLHFEDGSSQQTHVDAFLGSAAQPLSDSQLSELFRNAAHDLVLPRRAGEILHGLWGLDQAPDSRLLTGLLRRG